MDPSLTIGIAVASLAGPACGSDDSVAGGPQAMQAAARCAINGGAEKAVSLTVLAIKHFWDVHAPLEARGAQRVIAVGNHEGVHRGDYYIARDEHDNRHGFARVEEVGEGGENSPSVLKFKAGNPALGTQMWEDALLGVQLGVRPGAMYLLSHGDFKTRVAFGGDLTVAYDLTRAITWFDEVWLRSNIGYFYASSKEGLLDFDAGFDGITYFGGGVSSILGVAFSGFAPSISRLDAATGKDVSYSGFSAGALARLGLEFAFSPTWTLSLLGEGRTGFSNVVLKNNQSTVTYSGDHMAAVMGRLSVAHTF